MSPIFIKGQLIRYSPRHKGEFPIWVVNEVNLKKKCYNLVRADNTAIQHVLDFTREDRYKAVIE